MKNLDGRVFSPTASAALDAWVALWDVRKEFDPWWTRFAGGLEDEHKLLSAAQQALFCLFISELRDQQTKGATT